MEWQHTEPAHKGHNVMSGSESEFTNLWILRLGSEVLTFKHNTMNKSNAIMQTIRQERQSQMVKSILETSTEAVVDPVANLKGIIRVLHVDDDVDFLKTAKSCLERQGSFEVDDASSVEDALKKTGETQYDAVISDYEMPGKDGLQFLKELRDKGDDTPFIIFTGKGREELAIRALNLGADQYLNKSGDPETVYTELAHSLRKAAERKNAVQMLRASEEKYKSLVENSKDSIVIIDLKGNVLFANKATEELTGYTDRTTRMNLRRVTPLKYWPKSLSMLWKARKGKQIPYFESMVRRKDGRLVPVESGGQAIFEDGKVVGIQIITRDISERKRAEEELRHFSSAVKASLDGIAISDVDGRIIDVNDAILRIYGTKDGNDLIGKSYFDLVIPEEREAAFESMKQVLKNGYVGSREYNIINKQGNISPVEFSATLMRDGEARPIGFVGIVRGIAEHKKAEDALRRSSVQARSLVEFQNKVIDTAIVWIDLLDKEGNVTLWNRAAEIISGYTREEVMGHKKIWEWLYPDPQYCAKAFARAKRIIDEKLGLNFETEIRCKNGTSKTISWYTNSITNEKGKPVGSIAIGLDVSQLKKTERELHETMEKLQVMNEKLQVVGGLTRHDARNKLTAITGNVYLAKKKLVGNIEVRDYLKQIEACVEQTVRIFDLAKTYEMLGVEQLAYVDLERTVNEAISLFPDLKGVRMVNDCHGLTVLADSLLTQVFYNLVGNSLKYGKKLSRIRIYCEEKYDHVNVIYEDDGVGVPADEKPKLFKEGYSTGGSTGYGLYLIKKMTEVYSWAIKETGQPGKGALFTLTIPKTDKSGRISYILH